MDFTVNKYIQLLETITKEGYQFLTFTEFINGPGDKNVILRHDVDLKPKNALNFARIQHKKGIIGVYYFRAIPQSWNEHIIQEIADMGHEIGYHYECLTTCKGNVNLAIKDFERHLTALRRLVPVSTICMHGSPMSRYDSRDMWKTHSYRDFGIVGEPYFDVDFNKVAYLTDTGRWWNGDKVSVRDKVNSRFSYSFKNTDGLISAFTRKKLPEQILFTFHPQRWNANPLDWISELVLQSAKNVVKRYFYSN